MNNQQLELTNNGLSTTGSTTVGTREASTGAIQRMYEWLRRLLGLTRGRPDPAARPPQAPNLASDAPPGEEGPSAEVYDLWWRRVREYPGISYPNLRTRRSMRSGAWMWVCHALANGLDPTQPDWAAVGEMFAKSNLKQSTKRSYRSHISWWFAWCSIKQAEWGKRRQSPEDDG